MPYNQKLELSRTLGFEIECFVEHYYDDGYYDDDDNWVDSGDIDNCIIGHDGSLCGGRGSAYEIKTLPIKNLNILEDVYGELNDNGMNVNSSCGLHIHVGSGDLTVEDKAKLLRFGAGIELLMYSLVESSRWGNSYCEKLHKGWRKLYRNSFINQNIPFHTFRSLGDLNYFVRSNANGDDRNIWNGRYQWLNADVSHCPTVEFRIFSSTTDYKQAQQFGMLAYHIVETVKNSTIEQIKFIIKSIYQSTTTDEMFTRFFDSIGLDQEFRPEIKNQSRVDYLDTKYCEPNRVALSEQQAEAV